MAVVLGTSGWQYRSWRGRFYSQGLRQSDWLLHYAERFQAVEVNNAFYRLPEASTFAAWATRTPDDFVVAVKASRYLTHVRRLADPTGPVTRLMERAVHLGDKLGPILLQLPPDFPADPDRLDDTLGAFPRSLRVAVELRHPSWFDDATRKVLERRGAALVLADSPKRETPTWRTADWGYVRFHEGRAQPPPCYGRQALATWAQRLARSFGSGDDVYAFFNNDAEGCAVRDAVRFAGALRKVGMRPTRVPAAREAHVGGAPGRGQSSP